MISENVLKDFVRYALRKMDELVSMREWRDIDFARGTRQGYVDCLKFLRDIDIANDFNFGIGPENRFVIE